MIRLNLVLFSLLFVVNLSAQQADPTTQNTTQFCVFLISGFESSQNVREIDRQLRMDPDIQLCRIDIPTNRCYVVFKHLISHSQDWFDEQLNALGDYTVHCFYEGTYGIDPFLELKPEDCPTFTTNIEE